MYDTNEVIIHDFRNYPKETVENIFKHHNFSMHKINNFKKAFRTTAITSLSTLKGVKGLSHIIPELPFQPLTLLKSINDEKGNEKFLFKTFDDHTIESVLMPDKKNISICVSVQAGCKFGCTFCNTAKLGFKRNLYCHEILDQIRQINILRILPRRLSCVSFMGMGEPLDNLAHCMQAFDWITSTWGYQVGRQKITFSTSGCVSFDRILAYKYLPNLAVSIHSAIEKKRKTIMPSAKISLAQLKTSILEYIKKYKKHISIEYCLFKTVNDGEEDALALAEYLRDVPCKVNLLNYNATHNSPYQPVPEEVLEQFKSLLKSKKITVLYRKSLGAKIKAGCGQLGADHLAEKKQP